MRKWAKFKPWGRAYSEYLKHGSTDKKRQQLDIELIKDTQQMITDKNSEQLTNELIAEKETKEEHLQAVRDIDHLNISQDPHSGEGSQDPRDYLDAAEHLYEKEAFKTMKEIRHGDEPDASKSPSPKKEHRNLMQEAARARGEEAKSQLTT